MNFIDADSRGAERLFGIVRVAGARDRPPAPYLSDISRQALISKK
jgi:hypothetical protein